MSDEMVLAMCVGGFLGFGLGMMLFALVMRPADEAGRKSDAERIRRLEGEHRKSCSIFGSKVSTILRKSRERF